MNIELHDNFCLKLDELVSGDVEVSISVRHTKIHETRDWVNLATAIIPKNRIQLIIEFLERVK